MIFKMNLRERIHSGIILAISFLLVLASNRLNRRNFSTVEHTVNTVFKDRVVAQEYIYKLNNLFHGLEMQLAIGDPLAPTDAAHAEINILLADFATTQLTAEEAQQFRALQKEHERLQTLVASNVPQEGNEKALLLQSIGTHLDQLARIQLSESRNLTQLSNKSLRMNQLLSNLEITFLILLGLLFLFVMFNRTTTPHLLGHDSE